MLYVYHLRNGIIARSGRSRTQDSFTGSQLGSMDAPPEALHVQHLRNSIIVSSGRSRTYEDIGRINIGWLLRIGVYHVKTVSNEWKILLSHAIEKRSKSRYKMYEDAGRVTSGRVLVRIGVYYVKTVSKRMEDSSKPCYRQTFEIGV